MFSLLRKKACYTEKKKIIHTHAPRRKFVLHEWVKKTHAYTKSPHSPSTVKWSTLIFFFRDFGSSPAQTLFSQDEKKKTMTVPNFVFHVENPLDICFLHCSLLISVWLSALFRYYYSVEYFYNL